MVLYSGHQEALALFPGKIFTFSVRGEQFIGHLFTLAYLVVQEKGQNQLTSGGGPGRR
jgi:hypothetical protein